MSSFDLGFYLFCLISYLWAEWWRKEKTCFFFFSWIWGNSFLAFVGTAMNCQTMVVSFTPGTLLSVNPFDDKNEGSSLHFILLLVVDPRPENPKLLIQKWHTDIGFKVLLQLMVGILTYLCADKLFISLPLKSMNFLLFWIKAVLKDLYSVNICDASTLCQDISHKLSHLI